MGLMGEKCRVRSSGRCRVQHWEGDFFLRKISDINSCSFQIYDQIAIKIKNKLFFKLEIINQNSYVKHKHKT